MTQFPTLKTIQVLILAAMASTATAALAQDAPPRADFAAMDADKDGNITKAESDAFQAAQVAAMDADKDGKITAEELAAFHLAKMKENMDARAKDHADHMIADLDTDKDGALSMEELAARKGNDRMFDRIDGNSDGVLSAEEIAAAQNFMDKKGRGGRHGEGHKGGFWGMFGN